MNFHVGALAREKPPFRAEHIGSLLRSAMNSLRLFAGTDGMITRAVGTVASAVMGVKSASL
jgi:hypothetical protein